MLINSENIMTVINYRYINDQGSIRSLFALHRSSAGDLLSHLFTVTVQRFSVYTVEKVHTLGIVYPFQ